MIYKYRMYCLREFMILILLSIVFMSVIMIDNAEAIPAFARKYQTACTTCHQPFPRLTGVAEAFRLNGYMMPGGDAAMIKDPPLMLGSPVYKRVFPKSVWPSDIPGMPPIALRIYGGVNFDLGRNRDMKAIIEFPSYFEVLTAGSMGTSVSWWGALELYTTGEFDAGIKPSAWIMLDDLFIEDNLINLKLGMLGMQDVALPNTRSFNRMGMGDYLYTEELKMGHGKPGVELNGFTKIVRWHFGFSSLSYSMDYNLYGVLAFKFGGTGYDGIGGSTSEGGSGGPAGPWVDNSIAFGFLYYKSWVSPGQSTIDRYGADIRWNQDNLTVAGGYICGDENKDTTKPEGSFQISPAGFTQVFFGEVNYSLFPWMIPYTLIEVSTTTKLNSDVQSMIFGTVFIFRANIKFYLECQFFLVNEPYVKQDIIYRTTKDANTVKLRIDFAY